MTPARRNPVVGTITPAPTTPAYDRRSSSRAAGAPPAVFDPVTVPLEPGISLVEASAGTGKTYSITLTVLRLLLEPNPDGSPRTIGRILVVTFTNAATDELITRLRTALRTAVDVFAGVETDRKAHAQLFQLHERYGAAGLERLREALRSLDQLSVFTIHGFCKRVLEESALESRTPYDATFLEEDALLVERVAQDWWRRTMYEDEQLATLAVHREWQWNEFLPALKVYRRWPDTVIDPDLPLDQARRGLGEALAAFRAGWDRERATAFFAARNWIGTSPLKTEEGRASLLDSGDALAAGDLARGMAIVRDCCSAKLLHEKNGVGKRQKPPELYAATGREPFVLALDAVAARLDDVHKALRVSCIRTVDREFGEEKRRRHLLGFDDLLRQLCDAIRGQPDGHLARAIRRRYDAALIDEFQDTDPYQFPIFSTAFTGRPLFLIGDPKQAIYGFRGADIFAYMAAADQASPQYTLQRNWRSTGALVGAVNRVFAHRPRPFLYEQIPFAEVTAARNPADFLAGDGRGAMHWWFLAADDGKALNKGKAQERIREAVSREIVALLSRKGAGGEPLCDARGDAMTPRRIAVLVRDRYEGEAIQQALTGLGVPAIIAGMGDILQSREMTELERVLRAVERPHHPPTVRAALATEMWGLDAAAIHRLGLPEQEPEWQGLIERLADARATWTRHGFMRMVQELIASLGVPGRLLAFRDGERRLTNLRHAVELLHEVATDERCSPEALLLWIARSRARGDQDRERTELRLESDADAVQIVTIHKSKGLEYDVVFCPSLLLPKIADDDAPVAVHEGDDVVFDHGSERRAHRGTLANAERLAEDLRLAYVALTRARFRVYVAWGAACNAKKKAEAAWASGLGWLLRGSDAEGTEATMAAQVAREEEQAIGEWWTRLEALVRGAGADVMTAERLDGGAGRVEPWQGAGAAAAAPAFRQVVPTKPQLATWRIASFTSLTANRHVEDARDVTDGESSEPAADAPVLPRSDFMAFPAGRHAGIALHEIFERIDFAAPAAERDAFVAQVLRKFRFVETDDDARIAATSGMVERVLGTTLPGAGFALRDVPLDRRLNEWKFHLPLGAIEEGTLAELFATHGDALARRYAPALRPLSRERTFGFLTGVVDLAFEHDGRWHVVDWKSNLLGTDPAAYEPAALEPEMAGSHYVLQYHLYVTALHRFLRQRVPGYSYATHMGDVRYAFLRGVDGSARGWHHHRPAESLIAALDALMSAGGGASFPTSGSPSA